MAWLVRAHDASGGRGVSKNYILGRGWNHPYPETTGYIIPTFLDWAARSGDASFADRAAAMGGWEIEIQTPGGGIQQGMRTPREPLPPIAFNTGVVLKGFVRLHRHTGESRFLDAAVRAGDWLVEHLDADGAWRRGSYQGIPHTYHSRCAWSLLLLHEIAPDPRYRAAAARHLDWVVSTQAANGFFPEARFFPGRLPNTHGLAYTHRGLLESHRLTGEPSWLEAAVRGAVPVRREIETRGRLYGIYDAAWRPASRFDCLTAIAQHALVWYRLSDLEGREDWRAPADRALDLLIALQDRTSGNGGVRGGIKGSHPVWGRYAPFQFPNWAAKFFADALMLRHPAPPKHGGAGGETGRGRAS
jgi:uncharacterized protein YyaL (SSP411 family)